MKRQSTPDDSSLKMGFDKGTKDQTCWVLREGLMIIGAWDHEPTQDEIDYAVASAGLEQKEIIK